LPDAPSSRLLAAAAAVLSLAVAPATASAHAASVRPDRVVVTYKGSTRIHTLRTAHPTATIARLRRDPAVRYAVPDVVAHTAAAYLPDDPGRGLKAGRWAAVQWNFTGPNGVDAPDAWAHLIAAGRPGGKGVKVAVLDTGVAYREFGKTPADPDLAGTRFVAGRDFIGHDDYANDRNGHGTHVTSTIAETTDNGIGLTGLAYGASIMPVKVLDDLGEGDAPVIAQGVRWATDHGAKIINMSLEFDSTVGRDQIPELIDAIAYARAKGVLVVAASGNEGESSVAYPARNVNVLAVGGTTEHGCLADYSNSGHGLDLVAPGGGDDAPLDDPGCSYRKGRPGRNIAQMTLIGVHKDKIGIPHSYEGTSMAVPHVSATAALIVASGILGSDPSPAAIEHRLEATARDLGTPGYDTDYGWGLVNAAAATDPAVPLT
jgi:serine protease